MNGFFGRRNAWADGPPPGGGNFDPVVGGNIGGGDQHIWQTLRDKLELLCIRGKRKRRIDQFIRRH